VGQRDGVRRWGGGTCVGCREGTTRPSEGGGDKDSKVGGNEGWGE